MKRYTTILFCILMGLFEVMPIHSAPLPEKQSSVALLKEAEECINVGNDSLTQRALRCLSIVATRYYSSPEDKETRKNAVKALREMGNLYMTYAIDYKSAYRNLLLARQIAEEDKILQELPYIYMSLANLYSVNTTTENSMRLSPLTAESLSKSLEAAVAADNDTILIPLLTNIILVSLNHPEIQPDLAKSLDHVREHKFAVGSEIGNFTNLLIAGLDKYWAGDLKGGVDLVLKSKERGIGGAYHERTEYGLSLIVILMLEQAGDYPRAIEYVRDVMDKAASCGHTDYELAMYSRLVNLYKETGQKDSLDKYYNKYLSLKQTQEEVGNLHSVEALQLLSELENINKEVELLSIKRQEERRQRLMLFGGVVILVIVLSALIYVHVNLKRNHLNLFRRHEEASRREARQEMMRRELEKKIVGLQNEIESLKANTVSSAESTSEDSESGDSEILAEELLPLYTRIVAEAERSENIYSAGYSLASMAQAVGSQSRSVSKAINAIHGCNFHQFLNEYRIKRACSIMHSPEKDSYTIEAIAEEVGFKSRTSFANLFKKSTGLTPTDYWKMARSERE